MNALLFGLCKKIVTIQSSQTSTKLKTKSTETKTVILSIYSRRIMCYTEEKAK